MITLNISFTDFWQGHDPQNNIITNSIRYYLNVDINIVNPVDAEICFVTIYGSQHLQVLNKYGYKSILWLGENKRPNVFPCKFSISFDFYDYNNTNFRLPLWLSEIDWYGTNLGVIHKSKVMEQLVLPTDIDESELKNREFCIAIFNNPEGLRLESLRALNSITPVTGFGRPFGNWFPTYATYREKLEKMNSYLFNLCPENSLFPGYYTEKCIHSKIAQCIPIYFADKHVACDFNPKSFINILDFKDMKCFRKTIESIYLNKKYCAEIINTPLLYSMPTLDSFGEFLKYAISSIIRSSHL